MNLKEAFRYQNKLQSFMDEAQDVTVLVAAETEYSDRITDAARFGLTSQCPLW